MNGLWNHTKIIIEYIEVEHMMREIDFFLPQQEDIVFQMELGDTYMLDLESLYI